MIGMSRAVSSSDRMTLRGGAECYSKAPVKRMPRGSTSPLSTLRAMAFNLENLQICCHVLQHEVFRVLVQQCSERGNWQAPPDRIPQRPH